MNILSQIRIERNKERIQKKEKLLTMLAPKITLRQAFFLIQGEDSRKKVIN